MKLKSYLTMTALLIGICPIAWSAVTFTVSPTSVSNTYEGPITLQISGITSGSTVVVQKYLDINTNGIVDNHDTLVQQFDLTDGQAGQVIGNVTNYNVPGDQDATAGTITATLNFQNGDFVQNIDGRYLYVLSSSSAAFAPLTNSFTVTNFPFAQKFTGNVVSNSTTVALSNSIVMLFPPPRSGHNGPGEPLGGTVANDAGAYTIAAPVGTYTLVAFRTNFVVDFESAPVLALGSGQTIITNLSITNATSHITGTLVDSANNAIKLPGVFMPVQNTNGVLSVCFSDTNGNYTAWVSSGQWSIGSDDSGLIVHGYVGYDNGSNVNAGATSVLLPFPKANCLFYGTVSNSSAMRMVDFDVDDEDSNNVYQLDGYTDTNGNYYVGALGLGSSDPWELSLSEDSSPVLTNYIISQPWFDEIGGTNLSVGTVVPQNFTVIPATNTISGTVKDNSNNPITNVQVYASATIGGANFSAQAITDNGGNYSMNVASGAWNLSLNCGGGNNSLPGNYQCPNSIQVTIANNNVVTNFVVMACGGVTITTSSPLPYGEPNAFYNLGFQAESCNPSFTWTNTTALPPGLMLSSSGDLTGNPTTPGAYNFTVQVTDGNNAMTSSNYSLAISNGVSITTTSLPNGTNSFSYSQQLQATSGTPPYVWSLNSGALPPNLSLSGGGLISGMAATNGTFNFMVQVTDNIGSSAFQALSLYLAQTNLPPLAVGTAGGQVVVLWPASAGTNFTLLETTNLQNGTWVPVTNAVPQYGYSVTNNQPQEFFKLQ